jgi:serine/threonine-protein kinase
MQPGTVLSGKYRLDALLGRGGMGSVWRALHLGLDAPVAVKLMDPAIMKTSGMLARFHREAQAAAQLRSPHVVQIFDHGVDAESGIPFIVMELLDGESLAERLARVRLLTPRETNQIVTEVCRALARAHDAGIVHRDLKPANLFLIENGDQEVTKVLDFGIAKSQLPADGVDSMTHSGAILGTPLYMSPEQIRGGKTVDARSDLWSLAVVTCECLTGNRPFSAESIGALTLAICTDPLPRPSQLGLVPPGFDEWFARAVERDPSRRFQTARELADELRRALGFAEEQAFELRPRPSAAPTETNGDTAPQFGGHARVNLGPDGLPLAPTVDVKHANTGGLSKTSHELVPAGLTQPRRLRRFAIVALPLGLVGTLFALSLGGTNDHSTLHSTPHSALPAEETSAKPVPTPFAVPAPTPLPEPKAAPPPAPVAPPPSKVRRLDAPRAPSAPEKTAPSAAPSASPAPSAAPVITLESVIDQRR